MATLTKVKISNEWDLYPVRITARKLADNVGFNIVDKAKIEIAVSELARNIINYAEYGEIFLQEVTMLNKKGLKIIALDEGNGIENIEKALIDGFSTSNGLGYGLPSVKRLMDEFEIQSEIGKGTKIYTVKWLR
ncbi:anti-sigma regulatory factor [Alkalihalobacillus deserti]|uniref:anti-sigma regulatory factor n=1 Tax=Alkalihalobacillus deserti TaxID=2879466 RepID=UPI001D15E10C|nr:anti-sigma regulatory factor [Alkalihalobacillus deserti]